MLKSKLKLIIFFAAAALLLSGCGISDLAINIGDQNKQYSADLITLDNVSAVSTNIYDNVGNVSVKYSDSNTVSIDINFTAKGSNEDAVKDVLDVAKVKAEVKGDELKVSVVNKNTDQNLWTWMESKYRGINKPDLSADLDIKLPKSIQGFDITCNVGDINLNSLNGSFDITNNVGDIEASNINFTGDSKLKADVGDINCSLDKDMKETSDISIIANVGSVDFDTNGLDYTVDSHDKDNFVGTSEDISIGDFSNVDVVISVGKMSLHK